MADDRRPFAASVRNPGTEPDRVGSFDLTDAEDPGRFPLAAQDEAARQARLNAPPMQRPAVTGEERDRLVRGCADAVLGSAMIFGASDVLVRELAARLGCDIAEAERLLDEEVARRAAREG